MMFIYHTAYMSLRLKGVRAPSMKQLFDRNIWQSLWLEPRKELLAMKIYPQSALRQVIQDNGVLPTDQEIAEMQTNDSFMLYHWPTMTKLGYIQIDVFHEKCADAMPLIAAPYYTRLWYRQKYYANHSPKASVESPI